MSMFFFFSPFLFFCFIFF
uniref:Uncharacterized protein n=1 Tax=Rhizophora mucronata TaxID=61149 RepID=A0A2P2IZJ8_RHIMU